MFSVSRLQSTLIIIEIRRYLFTSRINSQNDYRKQRKIMDKIMSKMERNSSPFTEAKVGLSLHTKRRMAALNKIFMNHITDLMSTGEIEPDISDKHIDISHIQITPDFKQLNIFWMGNESDTSNVQAMLDRCAFRLRHELSQLRVMGQVPPIQFVECKEGLINREINRRLEIADYGEDYIPSVYPFAEKHTVAYKEIDETEKANKNVDLSTEDSTFSIILPVMKHNVFGINHSRIMSKIKSSLEKSQKARERLRHDTPHFRTFKQNVTVTGLLTKKEQDEQFAKFLTVMKKKQNKKLKRTKGSFEEDIYDDNEENSNSDSNFEFDTDDWSNEEIEKEDR